MRKAIQITTAAVPQPDGPDGYEHGPIVVSTALCDDGTVWQIWGSEGQWWQLPLMSQEPAR